jgi:hypothetical protein
VLTIPVPEIVLNEPRIGSLVGQRETAGMAQHVRVGGEGEGGCLAARIQNQINDRAMQRDRNSAQGAPDVLNLTPVR